MTTETLKAARQWLALQRYDHTLGMILDYLEGMEAVTTSQPVAQETTTDAPAQDCPHRMLRASEYGEAHSRASTSWWGLGETAECADCHESFTLRWVPAGSA